MSAIRKIPFRESLYLINAMAIVVLGVILRESIETIFSKQYGKITTLFTTSGLHFILLVNLIVDWISANIKTYFQQGISFVMASAMCSLFLIEGYVCILAFDYSSSVPLLIFVGIMACSILYDFYYFFLKERSEIYSLFFIGRLLFLIMFLLSYFSWHITKDINGVLSVVGIYVVAKIFRLLLIAR